MKRNFSHYNVNKLGSISMRIRGKVVDFDSPVTATYLKASDTYNDSLNRGALANSESGEIDLQRDDACRGMIKVVDGFTYSPDAARAEPAAKAMEVINRFGGFSMLRLGHKEETTAINRMTQELAQFSAENKALLVLDYWLPIITEKNNLFETKVLNHITDQVEFNKTESATLTRKQLEASLNELLDYIESVNVIAPTDQTKQLQSEITEILNS